MRIPALFLTLSVIGSFGVDEVAAQFHRQADKQRHNVLRPSVREKRVTGLPSYGAVQQVSHRAEGCRCHGNRRSRAGMVPPSASRSNQASKFSDRYGSFSQQDRELQPSPDGFWRQAKPMPLDMGPWETANAPYGSSHQRGSEYSNGLSNSDTEANKDYRAGDYPFLFGDVFGIGKFDCCDEWADHCPCLETTNALSACACTNPHRTRQSSYAGYYWRERSGRRDVPVERRPANESNRYWQADKSPRQSGR